MQINSFGIEKMDILAVTNPFETPLSKITEQVLLFWKS
jgi:hypothetical protein